MPRLPVDGLQLLVQAIWILLAAQALLITALVALRALRERRAAVQARRRVLYDAGVTLLVSGAEGDFTALLKPRRPSDAPLVEDLLKEVLLQLTGPLADAVARVAQETGLVGRRTAQLGARNAHTRAAAAEALGRLRARAAVPALVAALREDSAEVRGAAARALGRIRDDSALPGLLDSLRREPRDPSLHQAIAAFGAAAVPRLLEAAQGPEPVRVEAARLLGDLRAVEGVPVLERLAAGDPDPQARAAAARALGQIGDPGAGAALLGLLKDESATARAHAAWSLGRLDDPAAAPGLEAALQDADWWVQVRAAEALARLGPEGRAVLERVRGSGRSGLQALAREVLELPPEPE